MPLLTLEDPCAHAVPEYSPTFAFAFGTLQQTRQRGTDNDR